MADASSPARPQKARSPADRWPWIYALCCALAVVVMLLLYWFASHFNVRLVH